MEETRIIDVRREQGGTTYITAAGTYIKKTRNKFEEERLALEEAAQEE